MPGASELTQVEAGGENHRFGVSVDALEAEEVGRLKGESSSSSILVGSTGLWSQTDRGLAPPSLLTGSVSLNGSFHFSGPLSPCWVVGMAEPLLQGCSEH